LLIKKDFMKKIVLLVLAGSIMAAAYSQDNGQTRYSVSGGVLGAANFSKFRVDNDDASEIKYDTKTGWAVGAWLNLPVGTAFSIEPQLQYSTYQYRTSSTTTLLLNEGRIRYISVPLLLKLHAGDKVAITAGPQVDFVVATDDERNIATDEDFKGTSFSLHGGLELFPRGRVALFGRYVHGLTNMDEGGNHASGMEFRNSNFQVGLKLRLFGGKTSTYQATDVVADSDGDGINDDVDKCPNQFGLARYNGCPIPDSDGDGINDEADKCPNQAGVAKYEGCPIPDSDGDGINDEEDKCPTQAGIAANEGCPVSDRDNDGIADADDKCPDIAGIAANNGCPEVSANVTKSLGTAAQNIKFGTRNATLTTRSNASLDQIVRLMNENPGMKIRVEAHTDNVGEEDANEDLSSSRAEAVKAYLVSKGIAEDRIRTEGFGEEMPIADNNTAAGRAKNNRIEIKIEF
jgi:outer membrane protein OmpA-like peptidoglycan-associated protein